MSEERLENAVEEVLAALAERGREVREEIEAAKVKARESERHHKAVKGELVNIERRAGRLQGELEDLPLAHSRAALDDDQGEIERLKGRRAAIVRELEELEERCGDLGGEIRELVPNPTPHDLDARIKGTGQVLDVALPLLNELLRVKSDLDSALTEILRPLDREIDKLAGDYEGMQRAVLRDVAQAKHKRPVSTGGT